MPEDGSNFVTFVTLRDLVNLSSSAKTSQWQYWTSKLFLKPWDLPPLRDPRKMFGLPVLAIGRAGWLHRGRGPQLPGTPRGQASHCRGQSSVLFMGIILGGNWSLLWSVWDLLWYYNVPLLTSQFGLCTPSLRFHFHGDL